jgi:hypothetical protein
MIEREKLPGSAGDEQGCGGEPGQPFDMPAIGRLVEAECRIEVRHGISGTGSSSTN